MIAVEEYIPGTAIKRRHANLLRDVARRRNIPVYIMGSRAKRSAAELEGEHDLDISFLIDEPEDERRYWANRESINKEVRDLIPEVHHDPWPLQFKKIAEIFPGEEERWGGYRICPRTGKMTSHYLGKRVLKEGTGKRGGKG